MHKLLLSKKLTKTEYKAKARSWLDCLCRAPVSKQCAWLQSPHAELVKRMAQRDPLSAPQVGDRIPFVMIETETKVRGEAGAVGLDRLNCLWINQGKGTKAAVSDLAEDPLFALEHKLPLNVHW